MHGAVTLQSDAYENHHSLAYLADDEFSLTKKYLDGASKDKKSKHFIEEFRCRVFLGDSPPDGTLGPSGEPAPHVWCSCSRVVDCEGGASISVR